MSQSGVLEAARVVLIEHGVSGPIRWLHDEPGEWVFIVDTRGAANMHEDGATRVLMNLLGGKVWIAIDGPAWAQRGSPL